MIADYLQCKLTETDLIAVLRPTRILIVQAVTESLLFRTLILTTLLIVAGLFATRDSETRWSSDGARVNAEHRIQTVVEEGKPFGIGAEGWTAIFTGLLVVATTALFAITIGLYKAAIKGSKDAERLFIQDQRPWLVMDVKVADRPRFFNGDMIVDVEINIKNIWKSTAFQVTRGWLFLYLQIDNIKQLFERTRADIESRMEYMGFTLLPLESRRLEVTINVLAKQIEDSEGQCPLCTGFIAVCFKFKSALTGQKHELTRGFALNIAGGAPLFYVKSLREFHDRGMTLDHVPVHDITN